MGTLNQQFDTQVWTLSKWKNEAQQYLERRKQGGGSMSHASALGDAAPPARSMPHASALGDAERRADKREGIVIDALLPPDDAWDGSW